MDILSVLLKIFSVILSLPGCLPGNYDCKGRNVSWVS